MASEIVFSNNRNCFFARAMSQLTTKSRSSQTACKYSNKDTIATIVVQLPSLLNINKYQAYFVYS